jgi:hypothetical protein
MENSPDRLPLAVRAIDLVISDFEGRTHPDRDEQLKLLRNLRTKLLGRSGRRRDPVKHPTVGQVINDHQRNQRSERNGLNSLTGNDPVAAWVNNPNAKESWVLAIAGTGYGLIGVLVIILLVVMIFYFVRRVWSKPDRDAMQSKHSRRVWSVDPRAEHLLYVVFKRNIGTTVTLAVILAIVFYFIAPTIGLGLGIATVLLIVWWILFIING